MNLIFLCHQVWKMFKMMQSVISIGCSKVIIHCKARMTKMKLNWTFIDCIEVLGTWKVESFQKNPSLSKIYTNCFKADGHWKILSPRPGQIQLKCSLEHRLTLPGWKFDHKQVYQNVIQTNFLKVNRSSNFLFLFYFKFFNTISQYNYYLTNIFYTVLLPFVFSNIKVILY